MTQEQSLTDMVAGMIAGHRSFAGKSYNELASEVIAAVTASISSTPATTDEVERVATALRNLHCEKTNVSLHWKHFEDQARAAIATLSALASPAPSNDGEGVIARLERQVSTCSDTYEAPSGKIIARVWIVDLAKVLKLARLNQGAGRSGNRDE